MYFVAQVNQVLLAEEIHNLGVIFATSGLSTLALDQRGLNLASPLRVNVSENEQIFLLEAQEFLLVSLNIIYRRFVHWEEQSFVGIFCLSCDYSELLWRADVAFKPWAAFNIGAILKDFPWVLVEDELTVRWVQLPLSFSAETCKGHCYIKTILVAESVLFVEFAFMHGEQDVDVLVFEQDVEFETCIAQSQYEDNQWTKWPHVWMHNFMIAVDCLPECFSKHVLTFNKVQEAVVALLFWGTHEF